MPLPENFMASSFSLLAWNILHGGARRTAAIALRLLDHAADVIVLSEFRQTMGGQLRALLAEHAWEHQICSDPPRGRNGMLIASRVPLVRGVQPPTEFSGRFLHAQVAGAGFPLHILAVHAPDSFDQSPARVTRQAAYWRFILEVARPLAVEHALVLGDFNTGRHRTDEAGRTFRCTELLGQLCTDGYTDAWRHQNPSARDFTWFSHTGGGFRIDAAYASRQLLERLHHAEHLHAPRTAGESDHSALRLEFRGDFAGFRTPRVYAAASREEKTSLFDVENPRLPS